MVSTTYIFSGITVRSIYSIIRQFEITRVQFITILFHSLHTLRFLRQTIDPLCQLQRYKRPLGHRNKPIYRYINVRNNETSSHIAGGLYCGLSVVFVLARTLTDA